MTKELIAETLTEHPDWTWSARLDSVACSGAACDWAQKIAFKTPAAGVFRRHQAEQVAAALAAAPAPREDLTMFAALIAKLGGDVTVTTDEAKRLKGVGITRWDELKFDRYRFTLSAYEQPDLDELVKSMQQAHQCESWQVRRDADGRRYCAACGAHQ